MKAEDLLTDIQKEADAKKYHINQEHMETLNKINLELVLGKASEEKKITEDTEESLMQAEAQMMGRARLTQKLKLMEKRKELAASLIEVGVKKHLESESYTKYLENTFSKNYTKGMSITIKKGDRKAENFLKKKNIRPSYTNILGGFIFTKDNIHINKSFDIHLEDKIEKIEREIVELLNS